MVLWNCIAGYCRLNGFSKINTTEKDFYILVRRYFKKILDLIN